MLYTRSRYERGGSPSGTVWCAKTLNAVAYRRTWGRPGTNDCPNSRAFDEVMVCVTQYRVSVAQRKSSGGVTSLHESHFSPRYAASPAGESFSP